MLQWYQLFLQTYCGSHSKHGPYTSPLGSHNSLATEVLLVPTIRSENIYAQRGQMVCQRHTQVSSLKFKVRKSTPRAHLLNHDSVLYFMFLCLFIQSARMMAPFIFRINYKGTQGRPFVVSLIRLPPFFFLPFSAGLGVVQHFCLLRVSHSVKTPQCLVLSLMLFRPLRYSFLILLSYEQIQCHLLLHTWSQVPLFWVLLCHAHHTLYLSGITGVKCLSTCYGCVLYSYLRARTVMYLCNIRT